MSGSVPRSACLVALWLASSSTAFASSPSADAMTAERLFEQGVSLKQRGRYAEACADLAKSQSLDPGLGTQYHLADCYVRLGRIASAHALFEDLAKQAALSGQTD